MSKIYIIAVFCFFSILFTSSCEGDALESGNYTCMCIQKNHDGSQDSTTQAFNNITRKEADYKCGLITLEEDSTTNFAYQSCLIVE